MTTMDIFGYFDVDHMVKNHMQKYWIPLMKGVKRGGGRHDAKLTKKEQKTIDKRLGMYN